MPVIYADVVWLVNAVMDAVILFTTCWVLKNPVKLWRITAGAIAGACYALLLFTPSLSALTSWPGKAIASLVIVAVGVPCRTWLQLARACVTYYFVAFVYAGAAIAIHFAIPGTSVAAGTIVRGNGLEFTTSLGSLGLLLAIPCGAGLLKFTVNRMRRHRQMEAAVRTVRVTLFNQSHTFVGLVDTGNQLRDPLTRRPVCMVDASVMRHFVPEALDNAIATGGDLFAALEQCSETAFADRVSVMPYRGAGGRHQVTLAVRPDSLSIEHDGRWIVSETQCLLAIHAEPLSLEGRFQAILHIGVLTGVDGRENNIVAKETEHEAAYSSSVAMDSNSNETSGWR